jgi:2-oxoglutarate ferredoxin oxidoreductase subunit delta
MEALTRGTVIIDERVCKGCELCIDACPPGVLSMSTRVNEMGYFVPELAPGCTACRACLHICPDYVFQVYRFEDPLVLDDVKSVLP